MFQICQSDGPLNSDSGLSCTVLLGPTLAETNFNTESAQSLKKYYIDRIMLPKSTKKTVELGNFRTFF
jgi:hypothetical protein